ncbi:hypothetical protein HLB23_37970 [Nocardia uniformis]|uniref:Uncharacterized protein n=1 Tax=Nocardia uniformis TaxID=53432 RepID=A0A849CFP7_9NOCA|nr:hypothetical protein [Nocardia uniformis]NNH75575.1 hypothetical protein [Nocardia uniformis]
MAEVRTEGRTLVVEPQGWHRLWTLKRRVVIPLSEVRGVELDPELARKPRGIRFGGTYLPRVITAGTYLHKGKRTFWDVRNPEKAVVIELSDGKYARVVVEVERPDRVVSKLRTAIGR